MKKFFAIALSAGMMFWGIKGKALDLSNVSFNASFDKGVNADIARGKKEPLKVNGETTLVKGKTGNALMVETHKSSVTYALENNLNAKQGAIAFWISPINWDGSMGDVLQILFHTSSDAEQQMVIQELWPRKKLFMPCYNRGELIGGFPNALGSAAPLYQGKDQANLLRKGTWYHFMFTWMDGRITVYANGTFVREFKNPAFRLRKLGSSFSIGNTSKDTPLFIDPGCDKQAKPCAAKNWKSLIDDFTILNQYVFPDQATKIFRYGAVDYARRAEPNPVTIIADFFQTPNVLKVLLTCPGNYEKKGYLLVTDQNDKKISKKEFLIPAEEPLDNIKISFPDLKVGDYKVKAVIVKDKKEISSNQIDFKKVHYDWMNNQIAEKDDVLPPWTPVKVLSESKPVKLSVWGRVYTFDNPLPESVTTLEKELLASPVSLSLKLAKRESKPVWSEFKVTKVTDTKVFMEGTGKLGPFELKAKSRLEYDGMYWCELEFKSAKAEKIDGLKLEIPVKKDFCRFLQYNCARYSWFPKKSWEGEFQPYFWVGNDDGGIQWFAESDQYWFAKDPKKALEVIAGKKNGIMRVNFVRDTIEMPSEFKLAFGLDATPVKPRPEGWRGVASGDAPWRADDPKYKWWGLSYSWWSVSPAWLVPNNYEKKKYNPNKRQMLIPFSSTNFFGMRPYKATKIEDELPEWKAFQPEWCVVPANIGYGRAPGWNQATVNPTESFNDFYIWQVDEFLKNYDADGLYFDGFGGIRCTANLEAGFGYVDRDGAVKGVYPIMKGRELMQRVYRLIRKHRPEKGLLILHNATSLNMPLMAFCDGNYDGEVMCWSDNMAKIKGAKYYSGALKKDWLRTTFNLRPFGLIPAFDCRLHEACSVDISNSQQICRELFGMLIAHDIHSYGGWRLGQDRWINFVTDKWGMADKDVEFLPYWDEEPTALVQTVNHHGKPGPLNVSPTDRAYASCFINRPQKKMLVVVVSTDGYGYPPEEQFKKQGKAFVVDLNLKKLGLEGKKVKVTDAETLGKLEIPLKDGYRIWERTSPHAVRFYNVEWK
jgi:hypothetical protein